MDGGTTLKAKVVSPYGSSLKVLNSPSPRPTSRSNAENVPSRPKSPTKPFLTANSKPDSTLVFRPKAKVNSSATTRKVAAVKASTSNTPTPRSRSPANSTPRTRNGLNSPTHTPRTPSYGSNGAPLSSTTASAPVTPQRTNSLKAASTTVSSSITPLDDDPSNSRLGTLHHAVSFSTLQPRPNFLNSNKSGALSVISSPRPMTLAGLDRGTISSPTPMTRIRSKVSTMAKVVDPSAGPSDTGLSPSPAHPSPRSLNLRTRTASVSSTLSQQQLQPTSPPPQFYPITTAISAANPHRYALARPPSRTMSPAASQVFQPKADNIQAKADSSSLPAPPLSPPMSAVSFSSHSSVSQSSSVSGSQSMSTASSHLSPFSPAKNGSMGLDGALESLMDYAAGLPSADEIEDEEHKVKAAAKSNRKIADLEITNRSLLAINATLEATKHRQAREIRELKRKLRESRLILPPPAYRDVKSSLGPSELADDEEDPENEEPDEEDEKDEAYQRIRLLIDKLLNNGKRALEKHTKDFPEGGKGGAKVLTAEEVRDWHQGTGSGNDFSDLDAPHEGHPERHETVHESQDDNFSIDEVQDRSLTESEAEVEAMTLLPISSPPPIFVTKPSQSNIVYL